MWLDIFLLEQAELLLKNMLFLRQYKLFHNISAHYAWIILHVKESCVYEKKLITWIVLYYVKSQYATVFSHSSLYYSFDDLFVKTLCTCVACSVFIFNV